MRRSVVLAVGVVCLSCLIPALARADGDAIALAPPSYEPASSEGSVSEPPQVSAPALELSIAVSPAMGYGGVAGLGGNVMAFVAPSFDVGVALDPRVWLVVGGGFASSAGPPTDAFTITVPLQVQVYLDQPRVGAVVPTLRAGVAGTYAQWAGDVYGLGLHVGGGITWIASRWIALRLEVGATGSGVLLGGYELWFQGALDGRGSVVMRL